MHTMLLVSPAVTALLVRSNFLSYDSKLIVFMSSRITSAIFCICKKQDQNRIFVFRILARLAETNEIYVMSVRDFYKSCAFRSN